MDGRRGSPLYLYIRTMRQGGHQVHDGTQISVVVYILGDTGALRAYGRDLLDQKSRYSVHHMESLHVMDNLVYKPLCIPS